MADLLGFSETRKDMKGRRLFGEKKTVIPFSRKCQILTDGGIKLTEKQPLRQKKFNLPIPSMNKQQFINFECSYGIYKTQKSHKNEISAVLP